MTVSLHKLDTVVDDSRKARDAYGKIIGYHRIEIDRITNKWLQEKERAGETPTVPDVVNGLPNDYEWKTLFLA